MKPAAFGFLWNEFRPFQFYQLFVIGVCDDLPEKCLTIIDSVLKFMQPFVDIGTTGFKMLKIPVLLCYVKKRDYLSNCVSFQKSELVAGSIF